MVAEPFGSLDWAAMPTLIPAGATRGDREPLGAACFSQLLQLVLLVCLFIGVTGCTKQAPDPSKERGTAVAAESVSAASATPQSSKPPLVVLVAFGSEKKSWFVDAMKRFNATSPKLDSGESLRIEGTAVGSGAAVDDLIDGTTSAHAWVPASSMYREVLNRAWTKRQGAIGGDKELARNGRSIALSPIVLAMWKPMAQALGWPDKSVGWSDVLALSRNPKGWASKGHPEWGSFKFGHTHPMMSNSGTLSVLAEIYAALGQTRTLDMQALSKPKVASFVQSIEESVVHYGKSTGFFADRMLARGPGFLSAAILYENLVVDSYRQESGTNRDLDLVCIYPKEGTFWIDNPYYVLEAPYSTDAHRRGAQQFRDFLLTTDEQSIAMRQHGFRPADPKIAMAAPLDESHGVDPKQPQTLLEIPPIEVIERALELWSMTKKTVDIAFVFDRSGSMKGEPLQQARQGALDFLNQLDGRDRVSLLLFNHEVPELLAPVQVKQAKPELAQTVSGVFASGGTALYDAVLKAHESLAMQARKNPKRIYALVVLSDGRDENSKQTIGAVKAAIAPSAEAESSPVRVFTIAYGAGADATLLSELAELGGGASFKGDTASIRQVYRDLAAFF